MEVHNIINEFKNLNQNVNYLSIKDIDFNNNRDFDFSNFQEPVVIRGLCKNTFAYQNWNIDNIHHFFGNKKVRVENFSSEMDHFNCEVDRMLYYNMHDFIKKIDKKRLYMGEIELSDFNQPKLYDQVNNPFIKRSSWSSVIFFGKNSGSSMHTHVANDYILNQIFGEKTIFLFDFYDNYNQGLSFGNPCNPKHEIFLFDNNKNKPCNFRCINHKNLKVYKVVLKPGDSLLIPPWWWHNAYSDDFSCSITKKYHRHDKSYLFKYPMLLFYEFCCFIDHSFIMNIFSPDFYQYFSYYFIILIIFSLSIIYYAFKISVLSLILQNIFHHINFNISFYYIFSFFLIFALVLFLNSNE